MRESPHIPLWFRILLLATVNLAILGIIFAVFLRTQLKPEFESFLMADAREKVTSLAARVAQDLDGVDASRWDSILQRHSTEYGITLLLYRNTGEQLAGARTPLPAQ